MSLKCVASGDSFSKRNLWSDPRNSKTHASDRPLESRLIPVYKRNVCALHSSPHGAAQTDAS